ncbi:tRNA:m(4)X modification enzyme TRM13 [Diplonema papillatum]|nr:tRNA:m(4)X modification enzyme TRM13 [Diplonema papillatum]
MAAEAGAVARRVADEESAAAPAQPQRKKRKENGADEPPQENPKPGACGVWLPRKGRHCQFDAAKDSRFCGHHAADRVPCPVNPRHTVKRASLPAHVLVCTDRHLLPPVDEPYYKKCVNAAPPVPPAPVAPVPDCLDEVSAVVSRFSAAFSEVIADEFLPWPPGAPAVPTGPADPAKSKTDKHEEQIASLLGHLHAVGGLPAADASITLRGPSRPAKRGVDPRTAGPPNGAPESTPSESTPLTGAPERRAPESNPLTGAPERRAPESNPLTGAPESTPSNRAPESTPLTGAPESNPSIRAPESTPCSGAPESTPLKGAPQVTPFEAGRLAHAELGAGKGAFAVAVARVLHGEGHRFAAGSDVPVVLLDRSNFRRKLGHPAFLRVKVDLRDVELAGLPKIDGRKLVCFSKHLCGVATDYAVRCAVREADLVHSLSVALCCHQRCVFEDYVNLPFLRSLGVTDSSRFAALLRITSWAVDGNEEDAAKTALGRAAKRLLDYGRLLVLREAGYDARFVYFADQSVMPENCLMVATRPTS